MARIHSIPIIHAKLHRPPVCVDFVRRERLNVLPAESTDHPLILVSAPAGSQPSQVWVPINRDDRTAGAAADNVDALAAGHVDAESLCALHFASPDDVHDCAADVGGSTVRQDHVHRFAGDGA